MKLNKNDIVAERIGTYLLNNNDSGGYVALHTGRMNGKDNKVSVFHKKRHNKKFVLTRKTGITNDHHRLMIKRSGLVYLYDYEKKNGPVNLNNDGNISKLMDMGLATFSTLPEDAWQEIEEGIIEEQTTPTGAVQDLRDAGLVRTAPIHAIEVKFNKQGELGPATVTIEGQANDHRDLLQIEQERITVPVISLTFAAGERTLQAYNSAPGGWDWVRDYSRESTKVIMQNQDDALFNGYAVQVSANAQTFGYGNHPSTNAAASGGDWGTPDNAITTFNNIQAALDADNFGSSPFMTYVSEVQYRQLWQIPRATDNDTSQGRWVVDNFPNVPNDDSIKRVDPDFLADGSVISVVMQPSTVVFYEEMPIQVVEWQSLDRMTTSWRIMTIAAARITDTKAGRMGVVLSTGN